MEYLTLPTNKGINITDSYESQGGVGVVQLNNYEVLPRSGYRRVNGSTTLGSLAVPGEGPIRLLFFFQEKLYAIRDNPEPSEGASAYSWNGSVWTQEWTLGRAGDGDWDYAVGNIDGTEKVYFTTGNRELSWWDGTAQDPLVATGMTPDEPDKVAVHKNRLFLSFGPSLQYSALGDTSTATGWTPVLGAGEILTRGNITALRPLVGNTLGIWTETAFYSLQGSGPDDWVIANGSPLDEYGIEIGARAGTVQQMGNRTYFLGRRGVLELSTAREFGDFNDVTLSQPVAQILKHADSSSNPYTMSTVSREQNRYLLFGLSSGLALTLEGTTPVGWFEFGKWGLSLSAVTTANPVDDVEAIYVGDVVGFVHRIFDPSAKAFNGSLGVESIARLIVPSFGQGNPRVEMHGLTVNMRVEPVDVINDPPTLRAIAFGKQVDVEWEENGLFLPTQFNGGANGRYYRGYAKLHGTGSKTEILLTSNAPQDQPYVIDSVTLAFTVQGEDYDA